MSQQKPPSEHLRDKAEASAAADDTAPMERFKDLTRRLLSVSNKRLQDERKRHKLRKQKLTKK